jgi:hypothetical protein
LRFELDCLRADERNDATIQSRPQTEILIQAITEEDPFKDVTYWFNARIKVEPHRAAILIIIDHEKDNIMAFGTFFSSIRLLSKTI